MTAEGAERAGGGEPVTHQGADDAAEMLLDLRGGKGPVLAVALHAGHEVRPDLAAKMALSEADRLREEDPHTASFAPAGIALVTARRSRFEVDLNRVREQAVYRVPADAWGLDAWGQPLDDRDVAASLCIYDACYQAIEHVIESVLAKHRTALVLDLHSYNHRRGGPEAPCDDPSDNPEINLGTRRIDQQRWAPVVDAFLDSMTAAGFDARTNVKFGGGHFAAWVTERFGGRVCVLSIEYKKTFMDEWTAEVDLAHVARCRQALEAALPALTVALHSAT